MVSALEQRLDRLGYGISRNVTDVLGRKWPYRTGPIRSGGAINYFKTLAEIEKYADQCEWGRRAMEEIQ